MDKDNDKQYGKFELLVGPWTHHLKNGEAKDESENGIFSAGQSQVKGLIRGG